MTTINAATVSSTPRPSKGICPMSLAWWTVVALVLTGAAIAAGLMLANRVVWWEGFLAAGIVSCIAAVLGALPMVVVAARKGGVRQVLAAFLVGSALRTVSAVGGALIAIVFLHTPAFPTMLLMVVFYFAVLAAETSVVARGLGGLGGMGGMGGLGPSLTTSLSSRSSGTSV